MDGVEGAGLVWDLGVCGDWWEGCYLFGKKKKKKKDGLNGGWGLREGGGDGW